MRTTLLLWLPLAIACTPSAAPLDYGDPTSLTIPTERDGITAYVAAPAPLATLRTPTATVDVRAWVTDAPDTPVSLSWSSPSGSLQPGRSEGAPGPQASYLVDIPLIHGVNEIDLIVTTEDARRTLSYALRYEGAAPGLRVTSLREPVGDDCPPDAPRVGRVTRLQALCIHGFTSAAPGQTPTGINVTRDGAPLAQVPASLSAPFAARAPLTPNQRQTLTLTVADDAGLSTSIDLDVTHDDTPPEVTIDPVLETDERITLSGSVAEGDVITKLELRAGRGVERLTPGSTFSQEITLTPGVNTITVTAEDAAGNLGQASVELTRPRRITLRVPEASATAARLDLDRDALAALLDEATQRDLTLARIDLGPAIVSALYAIRDPERYGVDTSTWGEPERNVFKLLNMTPDTAELQGSSIEDLLTIGAAIGLPTPRIVADLLDLEVTDTFLDVDIATQVFLQDLIATHPNITTDANGAPILELSLYDVLQDLTTLAARFGPSGPHPGFLAGTSRAEVLEPGFLMSLKATSNLRQHDGVDVSMGRKDYLFRAQGDQALTFDFLDSDTFTVVGLKERPRADLTIAIREHDRYLRAGATRDAGADPTRPGFFRGNGEVWGTEPWLLGSLIAEAMYRTYVDRFMADGHARTLSYDAGAIQDAAVIDWARGWLTIMTSGGVGNPPAPLYIWDMLLEITQLRLHDGGIPPGQASVRFSLPGLDVGVRAPELIEALRPTLQSQQATLSNAIVGTMGLAETSADIFLVAGPDGPVFYFRAAEDAPGQPYTYTTPGMFDPDSGQKLSSPTLSGLPTSPHEKLAARAGLRAKITDDEGNAYVLTVEDVEAGSVTLTVEVAP